MENWTGLRVQDFAWVVLRVQAECFRNEEVMDHRDEKLKAVSDRYTRHTGKTLEASGFSPPSLAMVESVLKSGDFSVGESAMMCDDYTEAPVSMHSPYRENMKAPGMRSRPEVIPIASGDSGTPDALIDTGSMQAFPHDRFGASATPMEHEVAYGGEPAAMDQN